jgi:hypothetical protein
VAAGNDGDEDDRRLRGENHVSRKAGEEHGGPLRFHLVCWCRVGSSPIRRRRAEGGAVLRVLLCAS